MNNQKQHVLVKINSENSLKIDFSYFLAHKYEMNIQILFCFEIRQ
jgi:hypothetical protein